MKKVMFASGLLSTPALCMAQTINDPLISMVGALNSFSNSTLGNVLVITLMMLGMALAVVKNDFVPVMAAVSLAAFVHMGPGILQNITGIEVPSDTSSSVASSLEQPALPVETQHAASDPVQAPVSVAQQAGNITQLTTRAKTELSAITARVASLGPTVPVPQGERHEIVNSKPTSFWNLTTQLGTAGALLILALLGLTAYVTRRRAAPKNLGFIPSSSTGAAPPAFTDPHGFVRSKSNL